MERLGLSLFVASIFAVLAVFHILWAFGLRLGSNAAVPERAGKPVFVPSRASALAVAAALILASVIVLAASGLVVLPVPTLLVQAGTWALAFVFCARTIGDFRYVGLFKRVHGTPFANMDTLLYSPLCFLISVSSALIAAARS